MSLNLKENHIKLIENSGGEVSENLFVEESGIMITKISRVTKEALELFGIMNIDKNSTEAEQHSEFNSRATYMAFKNEQSSSEQYNDNMVNKYQHLSVYNDEFITFLLSGVAVETELEFVAHTEATVARLTSSKTKAQNNPLYKIVKHNIKKGEKKGEKEEEIKEYEKVINMQKDLIRKQVNIKNEILKEYGEDFIRNNKNYNEIFNLNSFGSKAVSFTITMSLKNWHKTLIGRLSNSGVEIDMLESMEKIAKILNTKYPSVIKTIDEYYDMGNGNKYN